MAASTNDDVIDAAETTAILGVEDAQIDALVDQGLLTPVEDGERGRCFSKAEVEAVRLQGG